MKKCSKCGYPSLDDNAVECTCGAFFKDELKEPKLFLVFILLIVSGLEVMFLDFLITPYLGKFEKILVFWLYPLFFIVQFSIILYVEKKRIDKYKKSGKVEAKAIKKRNRHFSIGAKTTSYTSNRRKERTDDNFIAGAVVGTTIVSSMSSDSGSNDNFGGGDSGGGCGGD